MIINVRAAIISLKVNILKCLTSSFCMDTDFPRLWMQLLLFWYLCTIGRVWFIHDKCSLQTEIEGSLKWLSRLLRLSWDLVLIFRLHRAVGGGATAFILWQVQKMELTKQGLSFLTPYFPLFSSFLLTSLNGLTPSFAFQSQTQHFLQASWHTLPLFQFSHVHRDTESWE